MPPPSFQDSNENQMWLRQKGSVKEFNAFFDDATIKLELPERYLVMTYMAGLKKELADSVRLFYPRTMHEAKILARMQEIIIEIQTGKARKELKDQEKGGSCSANTQEGPVDHTALNEVQEDDEGLEASDLVQESESHVEAQVTRFATEQNDDTKSSAMESRIEMRKEAKMTSNTSGLPTCGFATDFRNPETWKNVNRSSRGHGSPSVDFVGVSSSVFPLPSLQSLFVFIFPVHELSQVERNSCASKENMFEGAEWQDLGCTWLGLVQVEKSNLQLSSIFSKGQKFFVGVQLACNFSQWKKYFDGPLSWLMSDKYLGFSFEENSPSLLLQLGLKRSEHISDRLLQIWHSFLQYSPTQSLLQTWFRGELIRMLVGVRIGFIASICSSITQVNCTCEKQHSSSSVQYREFYTIKKFFRIFKSLFLLISALSLVVNHP